MGQQRFPVIIGPSGEHIQCTTKRGRHTGINTTLNVTVFKGPPAISGWSTYRDWAIWCGVLMWHFAEEQPDNDIWKQLKLWVEAAEAVGGGLRASG
jgi:hypothetical protein